MAKWDKVKKLMDKGHRFVGFYSNYVTQLNGETVVDAIKDFYNCYNAILSFLIDTKTQTFYIGKENDEPDCRGYFNYSYYEKETNKFVFNVDDLTPPVKKLKPAKLSKEIEHGYIDRLGRIYKCGFECHRGLAKELFLSETIQKPDDYDEFDADKILDSWGWVKISSKRIHWMKWDIDGKQTKLTDSQKKKIIDWMEVIGNEQYEFNGIMKHKLDILKLKNC